MSQKFLVFDTETGGLDPKKADILEAFFAIADENLQVIDTLSLRIKPDSDDTAYRVSVGALRVNRINLVEHHAKSAKISDCRAALQQFLRVHSESGVLIPTGHNVPFDIGFVTEHLINTDEWRKYAGHRLMDTAVVANFLALSGKLNPKSLSLSGLCKQLGIQQNGAHTASGDVVATIMVLRKFREILTGVPNELPLIKEAV